MNKIKWINTIGSLAICASSVFALSTPAAAASDPVEMLYSFQATGQFQSYDPSTGKSTYAISAVGRAPTVKENGIVLTPKTEKKEGHKDDDDDAYKVVLTDAAITFGAFDFQNITNYPVVNFSCTGCKLTYPDGSTLTSDPSVPLEGRALFTYGAVAPNPATPNIVTIRMAGCSGLKETAGVGKLAGKVGTICFNGVFDFDARNPISITGSSNCTIVTHTPYPLQ